MNLREKYNISEASNLDLYRFLAPYLESEMSEVIICLYYFDVFGDFTLKRNWKDKIINQMFRNLKAKQQIQILNYIEESE